MTANSAKVFSNDRFRTYLLGTSISMTGSWMQKIGIGWLAWTMTHSTTWLGILAFCELIPIVLLSFYGGILADNSDRLSLMIRAQMVAFSQACILLLVFLTGKVSIEILAILVLMHGAAMGINQPARLAFMNELVPAKLLPTCISINSVSFNLSRFIGPALAGVLIYRYGVGAVFAINAVSFLIFIFVLMKLRLMIPPALPAKKRVLNFAEEVRTAFKFVVNHQGLRSLLLLMVVASVSLRQISEILPAISSVIYGGDAETLALFSSMMGLGAVCAGIHIAVFRPLSISTYVIWGAINLASSVFVLLLTNNLILGSLAMFATGFALASSAIGTQILMQSAAPDTLRGRIMSLFSLIFIGGPALGALAIGVLSEVYGLVAVNLSMVVMTFVFAVVGLKNCELIENSFRN